MVDEYPSPWIDWIRNYIDLLNQFRLDDCNLMRLNHVGFNLFFWHKKKMKPQLHFRSDPSSNIHGQFKTGYVGYGFLMLKQRMLVAAACAGPNPTASPNPTATPSPTPTSSVYYQFCLHQAIFLLLFH